MLYPFSLSVSWSGLVTDNQCLQCYLYLGLYDMQILALTVLLHRRLFLFLQFCDGIFLWTFFLQSTERARGEREERGTGGTSEALVARRRCACTDPQEGAGAHFGAKRFLRRGREAGWGGTCPPCSSGWGQAQETAWAEVCFTCWHYSRLPLMDPRPNETASSPALESWDLNPRFLFPIHCFFHFSVVCCSFFPSVFLLYRPVHLHISITIFRHCQYLEVRMWLLVQWLNHHIDQSLTCTVTPTVLAGKWRRRRRRNCFILFVHF